MSAPRLPASMDLENPAKPLPKPTTGKDIYTSASAPKINGPPTVGPGGRKRRAYRRRGGFVLQDANLRSGPAPVGPQGPLGGRRRTRKNKGKKHHTRRR